jgi:hypothetical protein
VQDAFGLRSPVAALGFSVRTLGQMLEQGQLDALVAQHRAQAGGAGGGRRSDGPRGDGPRGEGPRGEGGGRSGGARRPWGEDRPERGARRIDPFARPRKPEPSPETVLETEPGATGETGSDAAAADGGELTEAGQGAMNAVPVAEAPSDEAAEAPLEPVD